MKLQFQGLPYRPLKGEHPGPQGRAGVGRPTLARSKTNSLRSESSTKLWKRTRHGPGEGAWTSRRALTPRVCPAGQVRIRPQIESLTGPRSEPYQMSGANWLIAIAGPAYRPAAYIRSARKLTHSGGRHGSPRTRPGPAWSSRRHRRPRPESPSAPVACWFAAHPTAELGRRRRQLIRCQVTNLITQLSHLALHIGQLATKITRRRHTKLLQIERSHINS
jgi:hypothetical protein